MALASGFQMSFSSLSDNRTSTFKVPLGPNDLMYTCLHPEKRLDTGGRDIFVSRQLVSRSHFFVTLSSNTSSGETTFPLIFDLLYYSTYFFAIYSSNLSISPILRVFQHFQERLVRFLHFLSRRDHSIPSSMLLNTS